MALILLPMQTTVLSQHPVPTPRHSLPSKTPPPPQTEPPSVSPSQPSGPRTNAPPAPPCSIVSNSNRPQSWPCMLPLLPRECIPGPPQTPRSAPVFTQHHPHMCSTSPPPALPLRPRYLPPQPLRLHLSPLQPSGTQSRPGVVKMRAATSVEARVLVGRCNRPGLERCSTRCDCVGLHCSDCMTMLGPRNCGGDLKFPECSELSKSPSGFIANNTPSC